MNENMLENEFNEKSVSKNVHNSDTAEVSRVTAEKIESSAEANDKALEENTAEINVTDVNTEELCGAFEKADGNLEDADGTLKPNGNPEDADGTLKPDGNPEDADGTLKPDGNPEDADGTLKADGSNRDFPEASEATVSDGAEEINTVFVAEDDEEEENADSSQSELSENSDNGDFEEQPEELADGERETFDGNDEVPAIPYTEQEPDDENEDEEEKDEKSKIGNRLIDSLFDFIELFIFSLAAVFIITTFFFRHSVVDGSSMERTLFDGEHIIISDLLYTPKRGDIIVCEDYSTELPIPIVKRVIGIEGDRVQIDVYGNVTVNGEMLDESEYVYVDPNYPYICDPLDLVVPEGEIFVMGDHRNVSSDSRKIGTIKEDSILGKVLFRFYPFDKFGKVE